jgi:hypothetical protein
MMQKRIFDPFLSGGRAHRSVGVGGIPGWALGAPSWLFRVFQHDVTHRSVGVGGILGWALGAPSWLFRVDRGMDWVCVLGPVPIIRLAVLAGTA